MYTIHTQMYIYGKEKFFKKIKNILLIFPEFYSVV